MSSGSVSRESSRAPSPMPQMSTWKKTVKALVSTVEEKPAPCGRESCQRLAQRAKVVPRAATQPSGRRGNAAGSEASIIITATPVSASTTSGRMRKISGTGFTAGPPHSWDWWELYRFLKSPRSGVTDGDGHTGQREYDLWKDAEDIGNRIHRRPSPFMGLVGTVQIPEESCIVSGHDFSRAVNAVGEARALAPAVSLSGNPFEPNLGGCVPVSMDGSQSIGAIPRSEERRVGGEG